MVEKAKDIIRDMQEMSIEQLQLLIAELSRSIFDYRSQHKVHQKRPHLLRVYKQKRARAMTIISQKQLAVLSN